MNTPDLFAAILEPASTAEAELLRIEIVTPPMAASGANVLGALPLGIEHALRNLLNRREAERQTKAATP